jgi:hypothetical protein
VNETVQNDVQASLFWDFGTSFNSRMSKTWVSMINHVEEEMVEDNVATPKVHQHGGDVNPFPTKQQQQWARW